MVTKSSQIGLMGVEDNDTKWDGAYHCQQDKKKELHAFLFKRMLFLYMILACFQLSYLVH